MDQDEREQLRRRLAEVDERLGRIGLRLATGYGSDSDRDGWLLWLQQLTAKREALRAALRDDDPGRAPARPPDAGPPS